MAVSRPSSGVSDRMGLPVRQQSQGVPRVSRKFFRRLCLLAAVAALLCAGLRAPQAPARASSGPSVNDGTDAYIPDEVNVKLFRAADLQAIEQQFGLQLIEQFGSR